MIREVNKIRRCPICGKPDWCCFIDKDDVEGEEIIVCKRETGEGNVEGADGRRYVYLAKSKQGNSIFELYEQHIKGKKSAKENYQFAKPKAQKQLIPIDIIEPRSNEEVSLIYHEMLSKLILEDCHREYLHKNGWTDELISYHHIATFPEPDSLRVRFKNRYRSRNPYRKKLAESIENKFGKGCLRGVPGAYMDNGAWNFYGHSGILFPMYDLKMNIKRLRIRMDYRDQEVPVFKDQEGIYYVSDNVRYHICMKGIYSGSGDERVFIKVRGKYRTLSSFLQDEKAEKEGFYMNALNQGCQSLNEYSLYTMPEDDCSIFLITEGEPKGLYTNYRMKYPVLTASGVTSYLQLAKKEVLEGCKAMGMQMMVIATDADKYENDKVMDAEAALIKALKKEGIMVGVAEWDERHGKGIDDCIAGGHWPTIRPVI